MICELLPSPATSGDDEISVKDWRLMEDLEDSKMCVEERKRVALEREVEFADQSINISRNCLNEYEGNGRLTIMHIASCRAPLQGLFKDIGTVRTWGNSEDILWSLDYS
jgi:hypothetical protein